MSQGQPGRTAPRARRLAAVATGLVAVAVTIVVVSTVDRLRRYTDEIRFLRARLVHQREKMAEQRREQAAVAESVGRLVRSVKGVDDVEGRARALAQMEETREHDALEPGVTTSLVKAVELPAVADTDQILEQLAWLEGEVVSIGDSMTVLTVLMTGRPEAEGTMPGLWPVRGQLTSMFGERRQWRSGSEVHPGLDIQARYGSPVAAGGDGTVSYAGHDRGGYGLLVIVDHGGGVQTLYAHLSAIYVRDGQRVHRGESIGALGATGRVTGHHLHYEVRVAGRPVNPMRYLD